MKVSNDFFLCFTLQFASTGWSARVQMSQEPFAHHHGSLLRRTAALTLLARFVESTRHRLNVSENKLSVNRLDIADRVHSTIHMSDVFILKTTHHMRDRIDFANV